MKTVERVLENIIRGLVAMDDIQFGFTPGKAWERHNSCVVHFVKDTRGIP